jgi:hypothetical protein
MQVFRQSKVKVVRQVKSGKKSGKAKRALI